MAERRSRLTSQSVLPILSACACPFTKCALPIGSKPIYDMKPVGEQAQRQYLTISTRCDATTFELAGSSFFAENGAIVRTCMEKKKGLAGIW